MVQNNPLDPLLKVGSDKQKLLFDEFRKAAHGHAAVDVAGAAINLLINVVRQSAPSSQLAEREWDQLCARAKEILMNHYDPATGRRRNVFPFTQVVELPLHTEKDRVRGKAS